MALADQIRTIHTYAAQGKSGPEIAALVGVEIGDVETVLNTVTMPSGPLALPTATKSRQAPMWDGTEWVADGVPRIVHLPFAFDTPGLATGAVLWTPQIGDVLFDAWIEIGTAWDGTTPLADVGTFTAGATAGWLGNAWAPVNLEVADVTIAAWDAALLAGELPPAEGTGPPVVLTPASMSAVTRMLELRALRAAVAGNIANVENLVTRTLPATFVTEDPVKVVVNTFGMIGGADSLSTVGAASLNLLVATPASG